MEKVICCLYSGKIWRRSFLVYKEGRDGEGHFLFIKGRDGEGYFLFIEGRNGEGYFLFI